MVYVSGPTRPMSQASGQEHPHLEKGRACRLGSLYSKPCFAKQVDRAPDSLSLSLSCSLRGIFYVTDR